MFSDEAYRQLRILAAAYMRRERRDHTLQPTALVHEAFLRMCSRSPLDAMDRTELVSTAALAMRHVLVDSARRRRALKRGGSGRKVALDDTIALFEENGVDLLELDEALKGLARLDEQMARIVELRFFGGLTMDEVADALGVSTRSVERGWRFARLWLFRQLDGGGCARG